MPEDKLLIPIRFGVDGAKADTASVEGALDRVIGAAGTLGDVATRALGAALQAGGAATGLISAVGGGTALGQFVGGRQEQLGRFFATTIAPDLSREAARQQLGSEVLGAISPVAEALGLAGVSEQEIGRQLRPLAMVHLRMAEGALRGRFAAQGLISKEIDPRLTTSSLRDATDHVDASLNRLVDIVEQLWQNFGGR